MAPEIFAAQSNVCSAWKGTDISVDYHVFEIKI